MQDQRPHLFLDVDGVLNAFDLLPGHDAAGFDDFDAHAIDVDMGGRLNTFVVFLSPTMGARLAGLAADISWATTWEHQADSHIAPSAVFPADFPS
jgi:hypothetical protein